MSQRPRHRYAVDLPCDLHDRQVKTCREVLAASVNSETHRVRPKSARLESVSRLKDVTTPVPHVLLSITLAGPAPSGSANTSRICQGCSHPVRHHPDATALSTPSRYDGQAVQVFHLHSNTSASRRNHPT